MTNPFVKDELMLLEIIGVDGSVWTISGAGAGEQGAGLAESPEGFWETPVSTLWTQGAYQQSATFTGEKVDMMTGVWTIHLVPVPGQTWQQTFSKWKRAWSTAKQTTIRGTTQDGGVRKLKVQLIENLKFTPKNDPAFNSYGFVVMQFRPTWPFWVEDDVVDLFQANNDSRVVLQTPIVLPDGQQFSTVYRGTVVTSNPTDWPMHHRWVIDNPSGGATVARAQIPDFSWETDPEEDDYQYRNRAIWIPSLAVGEELTIDSYPDNETWRSNINPMFVGRSNGVEFEFEVPAGTDPVDIPITCTAPGMTVMLRQPRNWTSLIGV